MIDILLNFVMLVLVTLCFWIELRKTIPERKLPVCYGLELMVGKRMVQKTPAAAPVSAHVHHKQDVREVPQTQRQQPTQSAGGLFFNRFTRNADLVASGVTKNIRKVGKYVKGSIDEYLYSYRGRPK